MGGVLRAGLSGVLFGGVLYLAGDTASDLLTYAALRRQALALAAADEQLAALLGPPLSTGAWYDATLAFSHHDRIAAATFQLRGAARVTDLSVKAGRAPGYRSNLLYNLLGPGTWSLLSCQAMVPGEGGLVTPRSLLPEHQQEQRGAAAAAVAAGGTQQHADGGGAAACQPCQQQAGRQQQVVAGGETASSTDAAPARQRRHWLAWLRRGGSSGSEGAGPT